MLRNDRADRVALAVVRLLAQEHQVGALALERLGQRVAGRSHVGPSQGLIAEVHRAVGSQRHRLVQRAHGALGPHRDRDDLLHGDAAALPDLHRRLDGVGVVGVEVPLPAAVHAPRRRIELLLHRGVRDLLHQHAYLHSQPAPCALLRRMLLARAVD